MDDTVILDKFFNRQEEALNDTREKYGKRLYFTALNILRNKEDAEECVNDTLLKAWRAIPPSRPLKFGAFLMKIARNLSLNKWEAKNATKRGGGEVDLILTELEDIISSPSTLEEEYEASLLTESINIFLNDMDKTPRVIFVLRYFHGESIRNISEKFEMNESKVKSILFRARKKLSKHLEKEGVII